MNIASLIASLDAKLVQPIDEEAIARAQIRVNNDFNTESINYIAEKTGHEHLATACYYELTFYGSKGFLADIYKDPFVVEGIFHSHSSIHGGEGGWVSSDVTSSMSRSEFWELKAADEPIDDYCGGIEAEELVDDFWDEGFWITNGWPKSGAEYLSVGKKIDDITGLQAANMYLDEYAARGYYRRYLMQELNR